MSINSISGGAQAISSNVKGNCNPCTGCGDCGNPKITTLASMLKNASRANEVKNPEELFKKMSLEAGGDGTKITKEQLQTLEEKLAKEGHNPKMIQDLIANFDKISNGKDSITSDDVKKAIENGTLKPPHKKDDKDDTKAPNINDYQDPSTITKEQLNPPIDIRV